MATVNLLNSSWTTSRNSSYVNIETNSSYVHFYISSSAATKKGKAKACIAIDASKYRSVTFKYSNVSHNGITDLNFGIFNNMDSEDTSGTIALELADFDRTNGGSISVNIPSSSGTKYVGFWFYGNSEGAQAKEKIYITSLTATERGYTLTYNANGGSGAPSSASNVTSTTISSTVPTRSGYDFLGWSTSSSATNATYVAGDTIELSANTTLYAVWRRFYTVTYDANGGSNAPSTGKKIDGQTLTLSSGVPTPPTSTSMSYTVTFNSNGGVCDQDMVTVTNITTYEFTNWNTSSNGYGTTYQPGGSYVYNNDVTLYAQYTPTMTYNSITLPIPSRNNYDFLGWSADEYDTSGIMGEYTPTGDVTLYAIWRIRGQVYICDSTGEFNPYMVFIYDGSDWNQYIPYIYTESGWEVYSG